MSEDESARPEPGQDPKTGRFTKNNRMNPAGGPERTRFPPGQSGNPGGKTSEQRKLEVQNAEKATRIRNRLLAALEKVMGDDEDMSLETAAKVVKQMTPEALRMLTDAETRGLGAPTQRVEVDDRRMTDEEILADLLAGGMTPEELQALGFYVPGEDDGD